MKVVILAGGRGTRLAEETETRPKPMVEVGGHPILWHIMKIYSAQGFNEFIVALGYKGNFVKQYFLDYAQLSNDFTLKLGTGEVERREARDDWKIHFIDTGLDTQTGGRVYRLGSLLGNEPFLLTYGDGVSNVDLHALLAHHRAMNCLATITAVRPPARFGGLVFDGGRVAEFVEKPQVGEGWINGGFAIIEPEALSYIKGDSRVLELDLFEKLAEQRKLAGFRHEGFWQCMDTLRDKQLLESLWASDAAPWKIWR